MNKAALCFAFAVAASATMSRAANIFVAPEGRGEMTGADWSNALKGTLNGYSGVRAAINTAVAGGATEVNVYFAGGNYSITNQMSLSSITVPVNLRGGYLAETDGSLAKGETATTFSRTANNVRHLSATSMAELQIEGISFRNGLLGNTGAQRGASLSIASSNVTITNCIFSSNKANAKSNTSSRGGAIYMDGGSLSVFQSTFSGNSTAGSNCTEYGGAICTLNADLTVEGCTFTENFLNSSQSPTLGGAIAVNGKKAIIRRCTFDGNYAYCSQTYAGGVATGGALAVRSATHFEMSDCTLVKNPAFYGSTTATAALKSGCYFDDFNTKDGVMTAVVTRCVFDSRSMPTTYTKSKSDLLLNGGRLFMTNCLFMGAAGTDSSMTNLVRVQRITSDKIKDLVATSSSTPNSICSLELVNVTIAGGKGAGAVAIGNDAAMTLKNCIVYGNTVAGVINPTTITYSCVQEPHDGVGNFVADPHWTGAPYYHLLTKRAGGAITDGWFGGTYNSAKTEKNSPCLDAAAPGTPGLDLEPHPNGRHVNLGAYGGTPWASKTLSPPPTTLFAQ